MGVIDEELTICTPILPDPITSYSIINYDMDERYPENIEQRRRIYKGQLQHSEAGTQKINTTLFDNMLGNIYVDEWLNKSINNISFLRDNFSDMIGRLCSSYWIRDFITKLDINYISDELVNEALIYVFGYIRYGDGECFLNYTSQENIETFIEQLLPVVKETIIWHINVLLSKQVTTD